jgi:hypothetical protein
MAKTDKSRDVDEEQKQLFLDQLRVCALLDPAYLPAIKALPTVQNAKDNATDEEYGYMCAMVVLGNAIDKDFNKVLVTDIAQTKHAQYHLSIKSAPVKTVSRFAVKSYRDYKLAPNPKARHGKGACGV